MWSDIVELKYIEGSARYDQKSYDMLSNFLKTGQIKEKIDNSVDSYVNICYYNSTRIEINKICSNAFSEGKSYVTVNFSYNGGK